jgi:hypothetical protein
MESMRQLAAAGQAKIDLGDDREGDHGSQPRPITGDDGDQDVLETCADHPPWAESLGACELHT